MVITVVVDRSANKAIPEVTMMAMTVEPMSTKVTAREVTTRVPPSNFCDVGLGLFHLRQRYRFSGSNWHCNNSGNRCGSKH